MPPSESLALRAEVPGQRIGASCHLHSTRHDEALRTGKRASAQPHVLERRMSPRRGIHRAHSGIRLAPLGTSPPSPTTPHSARGRRKCGATCSRCSGRAAAILVIFHLDDVLCRDEKSDAPVAPDVLGRARPGAPLEAGQPRAVRPLQPPERSGRGTTSDSSFSQCASASLDACAGFKSLQSVRVRSSGCLQSAPARQWSMANTSGRETPEQAAASRATGVSSYPWNSIRKRPACRRSSRPHRAPPCRLP